MSERKANYITRKFHNPIDDVLDRPIAFNPAFKKITGSTVAALMLSQAWYWSKRTSDESGWFYKTIAEWEDETGLTRSEQETARKHLKGIMEVELRGVPATLYYRLDKQKIMELIGVQFAETLQTRLQEPREQDSDNPTNINRTEITTEITTDGVPPNYPMEWQIGVGQKTVIMQDDELARRVDAANLIATGMGIKSNAVYNLVMAFQIARQIIFTESEIKSQRKAAKFLLEKKVSPDNIAEAVQQLIDSGMTVTDLYSVTKTAINLANPTPETASYNPQGLSIS
jgi:hypothetical protein